MLLVCHISVQAFDEDRARAPRVQDDYLDACRSLSGAYTLNYLGLARIDDRLRQVVVV